ncbi:MAG: hypothetical protein AAFX40_15825, partial [Cyanobacteria bacterium J06639_1]
MTRSRLAIRDSQRFRLAGWIAIADGIIYAPFQIGTMFFDAFMIQKGVNVDLFIARHLISAVFLGMNMIVLSMLRYLLQSRYQYRTCDHYLNTLIICQIIGFILGLVMPISIIFSIFATLNGVVYASVYLVLALSILQIWGDPFRLLKLYAYFAIGANLTYLMSVLPNLLIRLDPRIVALLGIANVALTLGLGVILGW